MKHVSNAYKKAMDKIIRENGFISISLGVVNGIAQNEGAITTNKAYWSEKGTVFAQKEQGTEYATFENNFVKADGSFLVMPEENSLLPLQRVGYCTPNCNQAVTIDFGNSYAIKGLSITFGKTYPTEFVITTDINTTGTTYTNDSEEFVTTDTFGEIRTLTITPTQMNGTNQRVRIKHILCGVGLNYSNDIVSQAKVNEEVSLISAELPSISMQVDILDMDNQYNVNNVDSFIDYLTAGQQAKVAFGVTLEDNSVEWLNSETLYLSDWNSKDGKFTFKACDIFELMTDTYTLGNRIYTRTAYDEAYSILTDAGFQLDQFEIDNYLNNITLTNPMPEDTHANCLQLLCNACRCIIFQDSEGIIRIRGNFALTLEPEDITLTAGNATDYSTPRNILTQNAVATHYADFTSKFTSADGSMKFLPRNSADYNTDTGYISQQIADDNGNFFDNVIRSPYSSEVYGNPYSTNGLTFTADDDGNIRINGTATANTWYAFYNNNSNTHMFADDCPWTLGDVLECDYFLKGTSQGNMGITWAYKSSNSYSSQGYIVYRNLPCNFTNCKYVMSDKKIQTINPEDKSGMYVTGYIYIQSGCTCDVILKPLLTVRKTLGNILANNYYRLGYGGVNNTWTHHGITYTVLDDGGILVNGTATAESIFEVVNPYSSSHRLTLEQGHSYTLSEGRQVEGLHRNPFIQLVRYNSSTNSYDYAINTGSHSDIDFVANDSNLLTYGVRIVVQSGQTADNVLLRPSLIDVDSYDENELNPTHYFFGNKPSLKMELEAGYTYYGLHLNFASQPPKEVQITTSYNGTQVGDFTFTDLSKENILSAEFTTFDTMTVTFIKGEPNTRVVVDYLALGSITDYILKKDDMTSQPIGKREEQVKAIDVKIYTYQLDDDGNPQEVEDNVIYTRTINTTGSRIKVENPLIDNQEKASLLAEWLGVYYANNFSYQTDYRGDPRLNAADIIKLEDDYINNLQVSITKSEFNFDGAFSGKLDMRRAMRE